MSPVAGMLVTLRPHQWVKNVFVAAPLVFAKHLFDTTYLSRAAIAVACFCALSGAVYAFNDVRDLEADRLHPVKRHRPIAAGAISRSTALAMSAALAAGAIIVAYLLAPGCALFAAAYLTVNLAYSSGLKQVAFVDVGLIATGFLLRVLAGAAAIDVEASHWLLICTALLALFLGLGKRADELRSATSEGRDPTSTRAALSGYRLEHLKLAMSVLGLATVAAYVMYTRDHRTVAYFGTEHLVWTSPFCLLGVARFGMLTFRGNQNRSPTEAMLRDPLFLLNVVAWGAVVIYVIYGR